MYASSGHIRRPSNNTLASYTACLPANHSENLHVKTIANMDYISPGSYENPHFCAYEVSLCTKCPMRSTQTPWALHTEAGVA